MPEMNCGFHPSVSTWLERTFPEPTSVQQRAWPAIRARTDTLISAPTGSGKTLAAFLGVIDELVKKALAHGLEDQTSILYVSPLKALSNDVQKNLQIPLAGIREELAQSGLPDAPIRAWVRTGDTPQSERSRMRKRPPHILVTTPESLYILLTSQSGRGMLETVQTVIVDEVHAVAGNKRGAHLALSLERLAALCDEPPTRVGISATTKPIEVMVDFLTGKGCAQCTIVDAGHVRERDLQLVLPSSPLQAVMANEVWTEVYDCLAELVRQHRTTLVFVNTRRLAERAARHLAERLGEEVVTSHHGSLAKEHRLHAEERLKAGQLKALVATASLELGIDIGEVDLVCQLGSPRSIATFLQRVGRSGHGLQRVPKGRLFPLSRDELVECTALVDCARRGELDAIEPCRGSLDVLAQQIVAEVSMREWTVEHLFTLIRRSACYRDLPRDAYLAVLGMLAEGFSTQRGRRSAHLHFDRVNGVLRGRRGARLTAITNGGAIPDQFDYDVVLLPQELPVGTLNEDFAFESLPGNIFQLGNTSYRIRKIQPGKVYVEDARGQPPTIPFWFGEAPGRSAELSDAVSRLRCRVDKALMGGTAAEVASTLSKDLQLPGAVAEQLVDYLAAAKAALGGLPTANRIVFERFFDEAGDTHLVIHSPLGSRLNRAWGLALRKRFCRRFNFELQAAALEDTIVISLGAVHSFPLEEVAGYLRSETVREVLSQALLTAPIFPTHWRWNATIALAVRRFRNGKKTPAQFQRTDAEDLLATVFPDQLACAENLVGEREIPNHPLVTQTMMDCLCTVMDVEGLETLLRRIESSKIEVVCRELASPSPLACEVLGAKPYAFLDDAPAEERRTLAVQARPYMSVEQAGELSRLDGQAVERVRAEAWPDPRSADELHDALCILGFISMEESAPSWRHWLDELKSEGRAGVFRAAGAAPLLVSAERVAELRMVLPEGEVRPRMAPLQTQADGADGALRALLRSRLEGLGPVSAAALGSPLGLGSTEIDYALAALEAEGFIMRGAFTERAVESGTEEWCERRLLARIHRYTLKRLRSEIEPVSIADYQRFLFQWQGVGEDTREGKDALLAVLTELQGLSLPAAAWEPGVLARRITDYSPALMDQLSSCGAIVWMRPEGRLVGEGRRAGTVANSPIAVYPREDLHHWQILAGQGHPRELSTRAQRVLRALEGEGALFFLELVQSTGLLRVQVEDALGELAASGLVTADSFNGLRALITPGSRRKGFRGRARQRRSPSFDAAGRWARITFPSLSESARAKAVEHAAKALLRRYGVVCRRALERESNLPSWRELLACYRRWEARGEIRGGRFVGALGGEQYALADALTSLRQLRRRQPRGEWVVLSAADPLNLVGVLTSGARVPAFAGHRLVYKDGVAVGALGGAGQIQWLAELDANDRHRAGALLQRSLSDPKMGQRFRMRARIAPAG